MITKEILSTVKTTTHLKFIVEASIPLEDISEEMVNDCCTMFTQTFSVPVARHIEFKKDDTTGKETISVIAVPKFKDESN